MLEGISDLATGVGVAFLPVLTIPGLLPAVLLVVVPTIVLMLPLLLVGAVAVLLVRLGALIKRRHA